MSSKTHALRVLLEGDQKFIAAETVTVLTARIAERIGFPAVYVGGHSMGILHFGLPDYGVLEPHEMIEQAGRIARGISIPTIVDADELGGNVASVRRNIREYCDAGIAGIHMEDDQEPKHSTWRNTLLSTRDMQARISAAAEARSDQEFVIVARTNELINRDFGEGSFEQALARGQAYAEAGADSFVAPGATPEEHAMFSKELSIPYTTFSTPLQNDDGVKMILWTGWATSATTRHLEYVANEYQTTGTLPKEAYTRARDLYELLEEPDFDQVVTTWASNAGLVTAPSLHDTWKQMER